jgi:ribokinase
MNEPRYDVLGLGAIAVDDILFVDEYPPAEAKQRVRRRVRVAGGLTGNALVAAARLGARCGYAGLMGDDPLSQFVKDAFDRDGVDYRHAVVRADARPAHSTIVVDQGRHTRTIFSSAEGELGPDETRPGEDVLRSTRVLLIDHHGVEGTLRAARLARQAGIAVVADVERDPGGPFADILALVDHLVVSQRFARQLRASESTSPAHVVGWVEAADVPRGSRKPTKPAAETHAVGGLLDPPYKDSAPPSQTDGPAAICRGLWRDDRQAVVVTCGADGCWHYAGPAAEPEHVPAFAVEVVDTTGCGDVFHGAYCAALAFGLPLGGRVRFAAAAAALKALQPGGAGAPSREAVEELLRRGQ